jgi:hypothetical protein
MAISFGYVIRQQKALEDSLNDRINDHLTVKVEEPQRMTGKWQIVLYNAGIFPPKTIKAKMYYIKDKIIWYAVTEEELPLPEGTMLLPDDGRNLENYEVYGFPDIK